MLPEPLSEEFLDIIGKGEGGGDKVTFGGVKGQPGNNPSGFKNIKQVHKGFVGVERCTDVIGTSSQNTPTPGRNNFIKRCKEWVQAQVEDKSRGGAALQDT